MSAPNIAPDFRRLCLGMAGLVLALIVIAWLLAPHDSPAAYNEGMAPLSAAAGFFGRTRCHRADGDCLVATEPARPAPGGRPRSIAIAHRDIGATGRLAGRATGVRAFRFQPRRTDGEFRRDDLRAWRAVRNNPDAATWHGRKLQPDLHLADWQSRSLGVRLSADQRGDPRDFPAAR